MEEAAHYFWFAERWNWTADQVDDQPAWLKVRLPAVAVIYDEIEQERQKAANTG